MNFKNLFKSETRKKSSSISHILNEGHGEWNHPELIRLPIKVLGEYSIVLERTANLVLGVCEERLPFPKRDIQFAIEYMLKIISNKESRLKLQKKYPELAKQIITDQYYNAMELGYVALARFVPNKEGELCERVSRLLEEGKIEEATTLPWFNEVMQISQRIDEESSLMSKILHQKFGKKDLPKKTEDNLSTGNKFVSNLLETANGLIEGLGVPKTEDIQKAAGIVLIHIISSVLGKVEHNRCYLLPTEGYVEEEHVEEVIVMGAEFLCFMGTSLCLCLKDEGVELPINDVITSAGTATFMLPDMEADLKERNAKLLHEGMEKYKEDILSTENKDDTLKYANAIMQTMDGYIRGQVWKDQSSNEKMIDLLVSLYMTLFNDYEEYAQQTITYK